jgi:hypothetical protein
MNKRRRHGAKRRRQFPPTYVNAYAVDQAYGGREEGGWYYDVGEALASVRVRTRAGIERVRERLRAQFADVQSEYNRYQSIGGPDLEVYVEDGPAADYPAYRPHYE